MKLRTRIVLGMAVVILPFVAVLVVNMGVQRIQSNQIQELVELTDDEQFALDLEALIVQQNLVFSDFISKHGSRRDPQFVADSIAELERLQTREYEVLGDLQAAISNPDRQLIVADIEEQVRRFADTLPVVLEAVALRDQLVFGVLDVIGPQMNENLYRILVSAEQDGDLRAAFVAGLSIEALASGRLAFSKYLINNDPADLQAANESFLELETDLQILDRELQNPTRRALLEEVKANATVYFESKNTVSDVISERNVLDSQVIFPALGQVSTLTASLVDALNMSLTAVETQMLSANALTQTVSQVVGPLAVLFAIVVAIVLTRSILAQLGSDPSVLSKFANQLAEGVLTLDDQTTGDVQPGQAVRLSSFEVAQLMANKDKTNLTRYMLDMAQNQRINVQGVLQHTEDSQQSIEYLVASSEQTASAAMDMSKSATSMKSEVDTINDQLQLAGKEIEQINKNIGVFDEEVANQTSATEESTASVEEIIASLNNVASIVSDRKAETEELVEAAREGDQDAGKTREIVEEVASFTDQIKEITNVISGITAQTNLLSMNAAIEAAHAGDSGKGFAVVAEEIRKLADTSSENSKRIRDIVTEITGRIDSAHASVRRSSETFSRLVAIANATYDSYGELDHTTDEMRIGGREVLNAMSILRTASEKVHESEQDMKNSIAVVLKTISDISRQVNQFANRMSGVQEGSSMTSDAMMEIQKLSLDMNKTVTALNQSVSMFVV